MLENTVIVRFLNGREEELEGHTWNYKEEDAGFTVSMTQLPLTVAFSSTIHKTQSQTLDYVIIDLGPTIFESGQAYTALSRVRSLDGLQIERIDPKRFMTNKKVILFYENLTE